MSDARVTLTVDEEVDVKVVRRTKQRRETPEQEPREEQRESWFPSVISDDGQWESFA